MMISDDIYYCLVQIIRYGKKEMLDPLNKKEEPTIPDILEICKTYGFPNFEIAQKLLNIEFDEDKFSESEKLICKIILPTIKLLSYSIIKVKKKIEWNMSKQISVTENELFINTSKVIIKFSYSIDHILYHTIYSRIIKTHLFKQKIIDVVLALDIIINNINNYFLAISPVLIFLPVDVIKNKILQFDRDTKMIQTTGNIQILDKLRYCLTHTHELSDYLLVLKYSKIDLTKIIECLNLHEKIKLAELNFDIPISFETKSNSSDSKLCMIEKINKSSVPKHIKEILIEKTQKEGEINNKRVLFIDILLKYPWNILVKTKIDVSNVMAKIDENIFGHKKGKQMIKEFLQMNNFSRNSSLCSIGLYGPPGIGKTAFVLSLEKSISNSKLISINLSGQSDGSILKGNSYLYKGSHPGIIIQKLCETTDNTSCTIIYFDEIDKISTKNGINEIENILISLIDNTTKKYNDNYFQGIDFPLNNIIFIFSYNTKNNINPTLLNRIYEIKMHGLSISEKIDISLKHTVPELCKRFELSNIQISKELLTKIITDYTNEKGVRRLNKVLERLLINIKYDTITDISDSAILKVLEHPKNKQIVNYSFGTCPAIYISEYYINGITVIQTYPTYEMSDIFTYNLSSTFKETIFIVKQVAYNYLISKKIITGSDNFKFHFNIPDCNNTKDGDSAACSIFASLISYFLKKPVNKNTIIIGALDICGNILNVGNINDKIITAIDNGYKNIYVPNDNIKIYNSGISIKKIKDINDLVKIFEE